MTKHIIAFSIEIDSPHQILKRLATVAVPALNVFLWGWFIWGGVVTKEMPLFAGIFIVTFFAAIITFAQILAMVGGYFLIRWILTGKR